MLIFGSTAAKHWFPEFREPKDLDIITKIPQKKEPGHEEYWEDAFQYVLDNNQDKKYVDPNFLLTIKLSHVYWSTRNFNKTIFDIQFFKNKGLEVDEILYKSLLQCWKNRFGKAKVNLNKKNEEFFTNSVEREFEHDKVHEAVAYYERPLFEKIKHDLSLAQCSKKLFNQLSHEDKIKCAKEEIYVTAIERFLLKNNRIPENIAIIKAMELLITSMAQASWFARFIVENHKQIRENKDKNLRDIITKLKNI